MGTLGDSPGDSMLYRLDLESWAWSRVITSGTPPPAVYSHATVVFNDLLILCGGIAQDVTTHTSHFACLHLPSASWYQPQIMLPNLLSTLPEASNAITPGKTEESSSDSPNTKSENKQLSTAESELTRALFTRHELVLVTRFVFG